MTAADAAPERRPLTTADAAIRLRAMDEAAFELKVRHLPELAALERSIEHEIRAGRR